MDDLEKWQLMRMLNALRGEVIRTLGEQIDEILARFVGVQLPPPPEHRDEKRPGGSGE